LRVGCNGYDQIVLGPNGESALKWPDRLGKPGHRATYGYRRGRKLGFGDVAAKSRSMTIVRGRGEQPFVSTYHSGMKGKLVVR
jgi:hypothetical protein